MLNLRIQQVGRLRDRTKFCPTIVGRRRQIVLLFFATSIVSSNGCGNDTTGTAPGTLANAYRSLRLNQHAITMSVSPPYNTVQLQATPTTMNGTPVGNAGAVRYSVAGQDTSLSVSATGLVTAKAPTYLDFSHTNPLGYDAPVSGVIASLTVQGVTLADTALIRVTATAPASPLTEFTIQPPAESISVYRSGGWLLPQITDASGQRGGNAQLIGVTQIDASGNPIENELVYVTSSDVNVAFGGASLCGTIPLRCVAGLKPNSNVTFYVQTWYYGVARVDSLLVKVGYQSYGALIAFERTPFESLTSQLYWWPATLDLQAPAEIVFVNFSPTIAIDAVFDDPTDIQEDTIRKHFYEMYGFKRQKTLGAGNVLPYAYDTVGAGTACQQALFDGTTDAADSTCDLSYVAEQRYRMISKPGTYTYHTLFGNGGKIIVH